MSRDLEIGDAAPDFHTMAVDGEYNSGREVSMKDFRGKPLVLYFYPKDDTPGCTAQACGVRDSWDKLKNRATILGVSTDSIDSHRRFIEKFKLPFPLLSDPARQIVKDYHVWVEKNFMGKKSMGVERSTFVIDENGRLAAIFRKVKPEQHVELVDSALSTLTKK
jgi:thioredoxin-dependent peroxiredoxin